MAVFISSISIFTNYNLVKKEITERLVMTARNYTNKFNSDINSIESSVNTLQHFASITFDLKKYNTEPSYIKQYEIGMSSIIKKIAEDANKEQGIHTANRVEAIYFTFNPELTKDVYEIWYADVEGNGTLIKVDSDLNGDYIESFYPDNNKMRWYYDPIINRKGVWSDPYEEEDLKIDIISYTEPVFIEDFLVGVVGMDINIDTMKNILSNTKIYDTGYAFLMCNDYHFLIHPIFRPEDSLKTINNDSYKFVAEEMDKKHSGIIQYKLKGKDRILGYSHLVNNWILGFTVPKEEVYASLKRQIFMTLTAVLLSICMIILIAVYLGKSISKPILKVTQLIKNTANFNFIEDSSLKALAKSKDEIGIMAEEMFNMRKILKDTGVDKAAILQMQSLQKQFPLPNKVNMETLYVPSKMVSGDFYHMEKVNDNLVVGVIYDVSGKGVTAALNTSAFNVLFHEVVSTNQNPVDILYDLNAKAATFLGEMYVAACCFSFDFQKNAVKVAGAGINRFMYSSNKEYYQEKIVRGPFLGMFGDSVFEEETICFQSGDKFYFFTDGLDFIFDDHKINENDLKSTSINEFNNYLNNLLKNSVINLEGIKDDCTLIALEIK